MNVMPDTPPPEGYDLPPVNSLLLWLIRADRETLSHCPRTDADTLSLYGLLILFAWLYLSFMLAAVGHRLFAAPGQFRIEIVIGAIFLSSFVAAIDITMVLRSSLYRSGELELKRAGLDITGGPLTSIKITLAQAFRIVLSLSLAGLTGICMSLLAFGTEIQARVHDAWLQANAAIIATASKAVDSQIAQTNDTAQEEDKRYAALSREAIALRQNQLDPLASDPEMIQAESDLARLNEQATKDEDEVRRSERFASDELGGFQGSTKNSGHTGNGPKHRAAVEQMAYARNHAKKTAQELADAQARLASLRERLAASAQAIKLKSADQTPEFERALAAEGKEHERLKVEAAQMIDGRDEAMRRIVEKAPGYVPPDNGLLTQVRLLGQITEGNRELQAIVWLIEIASFGFEAAAVLAKTMSHTPMSYTARLARDVYVRVVDIVDETAARLNKGKPDDDGLAPAFAELPSGPEGGPRGGPGSATVTPFGLFDDIVEPPASSDPPKRKRGRPRKNPLH